MSSFDPVPGLNPAPELNLRPRPRPRPRPKKLSIGGRIAVLLVGTVLAFASASVVASSAAPLLITGTTAADLSGDVGNSPALAARNLQLAATNLWVTRSGSSLLLNGQPWRFTGVNEYWLGLDDNVSDSQGPTYPGNAAIDNGLHAAKLLGARVVRATTLGVSTGSARSLEPSLGVFNDQALSSIDYAVARARYYGLRLIIPLTDEWQYYHGGKHNFTNWTGHPDIPGQSVSTSSQQRAIEANFYTDPTTISAFHAYIAHLLNSVNPLTGLRLGSDPTIAIWETGNELWDAPVSWTEQTAAYIKTLAPNALVADGSASTGKNIAETAVNAPDVDIIDAHFYPINTTQAAADAAYTTARNKVYVIGEYPLNGSPTDTTSWLNGIAGNHNITGDLAWTLLPYLANGTPEPHGEAYTFHYPGATPTETTWDSWLIAHAAAMNA